MAKLAPSTIPQEEYVLEILRAARRLESEGERLFHGHGITVAQFNVLNLLRYYAPMQQSDLNRALVVGKATVSSVLSGLMKRRLVLQTSDKKDRRAKVLSLSAEGLKLWEKASRAYMKSLQERLPTVNSSLINLTKKALAPCALLTKTY
jgi:DNA-binding MarR family transcriptional regulator